MSYAVEADTDKDCVHVEDLDSFICSDLNLYNDIYSFAAYGQLQNSDGTILRSTTLTVNGTRILGFGSCE